MNTPDYEFLRQAGRVLNAGQARTLILSGAIDDLFHLTPSAGGLGDERGDYVPLLSYVTTKWNVADRVLVVYELNGPIRFVRPSDQDKVRDAWLKLRTGLDDNQIAIQNMLEAGRLQAELGAMSDAFETHLKNAIGKPTLALELLRQMCLASRTQINDQPLLRESLIILIEAADLVIPEGEITRLSDADRHRVAICQDWFSDPGFTGADDAVILLSESRSQLNHRIARMPQILEIPVESAELSVRRHFIDWFNATQPADRQLRYEASLEDLANLTAGLSIHALSQLLKGAAYHGETLTASDVVAKVEQFIQSQVGEDVVAFKQPKHTLDDVVGFTQLKRFLREELIPRMQATGPAAIPGAAVAGPIGSGKTFIFEALAAELGMVVLVLKNIRSQWFGQTDVIFERLRRVLNALSKVVIFVDEADTQFGRVDAQAHTTERRLTGRIQAMMSDTQLRGRVVWLLMTARIHLLSPDIRRPGRTGDLIIPVLDPTGDDHQAFLEWILKPVVSEVLSGAALQALREVTVGYSAATFASLRSELIARKTILGKESLAIEEIEAVLSDLIPPDIGHTRRYQTLQALINCTRRSLLPDSSAENQREQWRAELQQLKYEDLE